jgi:hypothetical protein
VALLSRDGVGPSHHVLVEGRKGKDYKSFSVWMHGLSREELTHIMTEAINKAIVSEALDDDWDLGLRPKKHTHKVRLLASRTMDVEQRYVTSGGVIKPYHSSVEVADALRSILSEGGYV